MRVKTPTHPTLPNPQDPQDAPQSNAGGDGDFLPYVPAWERLPDAIKHISAGGRPIEMAQTDLCRAIADRTVNIQCKLKKHKTGFTSNTVLEGKDFEIPTELKPKDLNWETSCPVKRWLVRRGRYSIPGHWDLEWIEVCRADVANVLCARRERGMPAQGTAGKTSVTRRSRPTRDRAQQAIQQLYPQGVPEPATLPNALLCRRVGEKLKELGLPQASDDTILRVAGRRRK
jgi:hypothetical protein